MDVVSSGVATQLHLRERKKNGAGGGRDRPLLLPPFTRVQRYIGRGLTGGHNWHTGTYIQQRLVRVEWKMKSRETASQH